MAPFARELGLGAGPLICSNGAHIVDADGSNLAVEYLGAQARNTIIDYALSQGFHLNGYTTDQMFYLDESPWLELYRTRAKTIPTERIGLEAMRALDAIKLMIIAEPGKIKELATRGHALFNPAEVALTESEPEYLEFLPRMANKGAALQRLAAHLGLDRDAVMAVGDYLNDVEMVAWAGHGVAMGNAMPEVKCVAARVVGDNNEGGVADAIEYVLQ